MAGKAPYKPVKKPEGEAGLLAIVAAMPEPYRTMAGRLHAAILAANPALKPKVWYGMPGYATSGPVLCFFRLDGELMTFGLTEKAHHAVPAGAGDQLMASAWFFRSLDAATEARIAALVLAATA